jgi:hypothetical protein
VFEQNRIECSDIIGFGVRSFSDLVFEVEWILQISAEYFSIYNNLCSHSHANIRSLVDRHTHIEQADFKVIFFKRPENHEIDLYSIDLCDRIIEASLTIHSFFDSQQFPDIEAIHKRWECLKEAIMQDTSETGGRP